MLVLTEKNRETAVENMQGHIYKSMSPAEKWNQVCQLRQMAWQLKAAGLRSQHPDWTEEEIQHSVRKIFLYATT